MHKENGIIALACCKWQLPAEKAFDSLPQCYLIKEKLLLNYYVTFSFHLVHDVITSAFTISNAFV